MWTVQRNVGRLLEVRVDSLQTREEATAFCEECRQLIKRLGRPVVLCADYRAVGVFPPFVAEVLQAYMRDMNPLIARSGLLIERDHAVSLMQMTRVTREGGGPQRRTFVDKTPLRAWLDDLLTKAEQARLAQFLG